MIGDGQTVIGERGETDFDTIEPIAATDTRAFAGEDVLIRGERFERDAA